MEKILVFGHKNPDTDSVCAPYCYAWLKNCLDSSHHYQAGILGTVNPQTRYIFQKLNAEIPPLIKDILPKAEDIMLKNVFSIREDEAIGKAIRIIEENKIRTLPVVNDNNDYLGIISMLELADFFLPGSKLDRPHYLFRPDNFISVLNGFYLRKSKAEEFRTSLMVGAMAYETFIQRLNEHTRSVTEGEKYPVLVVGNRMDIIAYSLKQPFPALILTGLSETEACNLDLGDYQGWVFISHKDTSETIRILRTSVPVKAIANTQIPTLSRSDYLDNIKSKLRRIDHHGIAVVEKGKLRGLVTSSLLVEPHRQKVILIDHNELSQSAEGIEQADIIEIIDHHRLGALRTSKPIYIYSRPLGSSCTLIWQHFSMAGITPPREIASLLLSGILTDTLMLKSPTTTIEDKQAAEELSRLSGLDIIAWGTDIFSHATSLINAKPQDVVATDLKIYTEYGIRFGIAQMEVVTLDDLTAVKEQYQDALHRIKDKLNLDWAMLMITDITCEESILLSSVFPLAEDYLRYQQTDKCLWYMPGVLSRKKQLLPEVLRVLELAVSDAK